MIYTRYLIACIPAVLCIFGNLSGGMLCTLNIFYLMVLLPISEWLTPGNADINENTNNSLVPTFVLVLLSLLHLLVTISLIYGIYNQNITGFYIILASLACGINAGTCGIVVAHELIHRKEFFFRFLGILNLVQVNYGHFYIEHIKGHHKYVGTQADPATAKYGESIYKFIARTIPGQFLSAFVIERKRLFDQGKSGIRNFVLLITILQLGILMTIFFLLGVKTLVAYLHYSLVAIILLEYVNYIEHYGLVRDDSKKFEPHHAWQSNKFISRLTLIELSRHADHHLKASKPFHTLNSHPGYYLPSGYFGMFYIAFIPFLWFKIVNPIIDANQFNIN